MSLKVLQELQSYTVALPDSVLFQAIGSASVNINLLPQLPPAPVGASSVEQSIAARDPVAMALYAAVIHACVELYLSERIGFCIDTFQCTEAAAACFPRGRDGNCLCTFEEFAGVHALA
ncbi:hypothetical protein ACLOJK_041333 [Asimina triloba]